MFDVSQVGRRYFAVRLAATDEEGKTRTIDLDVLPPTVKMLHQLAEVASATDGSTDMVVIEELRDTMSRVLSHNRTGLKADEYVDAMDLDQLQAVLTAYFEWVGQERSAKN